MRLSLVFILIITQFSIAGKIEKGYSALKEYNYFKAKHIFEKSLKRKTSPAAFGLATIYYRTDNPFHSLDSAYRYIVKAESSFAELKEKEKINYTNVGFDYLAIAELRRNISSGIYVRVKKENSISAYTRFIEENPWSIELFEATHIRDSLIVGDAKKTNTSAVYQDFLNSYPTSEYVNEIQEAFYLAQYTEYTIAGTISSYLEFISKCPSNPYRLQAENKIFAIATSMNTIEVYLSFIEKYPENHNIGNAWRKIYQLFMIDFSDDRIEQFKEKFPNYPYAEDLNADAVYAKFKLLPFKEESLYGLINYSGEKIVSPEYEYLGFFKEGLAVAMKGGKYGYIDKGNRLVIDFMFDNASDFEFGRAIVEINEKSGMIDRGGNLIMECIYSDLGQVSDGFVYAQKDSLYGYYDKNGVLKIEHKFNEAYSFSNGMAKVQIDEKEAFIDVYGSYIVPPGYASIAFYSDSLLIFEEEDYLGLMQRNCVVTQKAEYEEIGTLQNARALFVKEDLIGYLDVKGQVVITPKFEMYPNYLSKSTFKGNCAVVQTKGKFGIIDKNGKLVVPAVYTSLGDVSSLVAFSKGKLWGFIDLTGKEIIKPEFDYAESFVNGQAIIELATFQGVIDSKGASIIPPSFTSVDRFSGEYYMVSSGSKFGIIDKMGKMVIPVVYDQINKVDNDVFILSTGTEIHYFYIPEARIIKPETKHE